MNNHSNRQNFHTHTHLCKHASGTVEDYIQAALCNNLTALGISDHAPYPDNRFGLRMDYEQLDLHIETLHALKKEYQNQISVFAGLEIEYDSDMIPYYHYLLEEKNLDFLALGQHIYKNNKKEYVNIYELERQNSTAPYLEYANSLQAAMESGFFAYLAHPDVLFINNLKWDANCEKASEIIIAAARKTKTILEFNANGIRRGMADFVDGKRYPYPHPLFWEKVAHAGLPVLINSDCHNPEKLWDECMEQAYHLANDWNLTILSDPKKSLFPTY